MRCTMQSDCAYTRAGAVPCGEQAHLQRRKSPPGCTELGTQKVGIYVYHIHPYYCIYSCCRYYFQYYYLYCCYYYKFHDCDYCGNATSLVSCPYGRMYQTTSSRTTTCRTIASYHILYADGEITTITNIRRCKFIRDVVFTWSIS